MKKTTKRKKPHKLKLEDLILTPTEKVPDFAVIIIGNDSNEARTPEPREGAEDLHVLPFAISSPSQMLRRLRSAIRNGDSPQGRTGQILPSDLDVDGYVREVPPMDHGKHEGGGSEGLGDQSLQ